MPDWNESTLRNAASWQAFKEGARLARTGAATVAKTTPCSYQGSVREGKRLHRVMVTLHSATHLDTRCSCPENQATGAVCAHAIAVGLAALAPAAEPPSGTAPQPATQPATPAWRIQFPPNWAAALSRARLAVSLSHRPAPAESADVKLGAWLAGTGTSPAKSPLHLQLADRQLGEFLEAIIGHRHLTIGPESSPLEVLGEGKLPLQELTLDEGRVHLIPAQPTPPMIRAADCWWQLITPDPPAGEEPAPVTLIRLSPPTLPAIAAALQLLLAGKPAELPVAAFLSHLDPLQQCLEFPPGGWHETIHFIPAPSTVLLSLEGSLQQLKATLTIRYGSSAPILPGQPHGPDLPRLIAADRCEVRDTAAEANAVATLVHAGFTSSNPGAGQWSLSDEAAIRSFLTQSLPHLQHQWTVTESPGLARTRSQLQIVEPKLEILSSGEDWLEFDLSFQSNDGSVISAAEVQRLLRSGSRHGNKPSFVLNDDSNLVGPLFEELDLRQEGGHFVAKDLAAAVITELRNKIVNPLVSNTFNESKRIPQARTLRAELRHYQAQGVAWLADRLKRFKGALLADDMGLGKTLQAIAMAEHLFETRSTTDSDRILVVATTSLLGNWAAEFGRFAPERPVHVLHGGKRDSERDRIQPGAVILTSYATLPRDLAWHLRQDYLLVVADEASLMRNPDTDHAKALCKLRARHRLALTGTPLENSVRDLWSIFRFILPTWLGDRASFRDRYEVPLAGQTPDPSTLDRLRLRTAPFLLRRSKTQVAPELPAKLHIDEFCDLSAQQLAAYQQLLREGRQRVASSQNTGNKGAARIQLLTALLRLRQACCDLALVGIDRFKQLPISHRSSKMERLFELLEEAISGNHKVLVFSQFRTQLLEIEKQVGARGWDSLRLDGQSQNRQQLVDRFQSVDGPPLFLISLKAGGYGLNLTAADTVIHFDPWWNPAAEAQATDRAHRIGQTRPVTIYRLLTRHTVEEKVLRLQNRKRDLAAVIDESGMGDSPALTDAELRAILAP